MFIFFISEFTVKTKRRQRGRVRRRVSGRGPGKSATGVECPSGFNWSQPGGQDEWGQVSKQDQTSKVSKKMTRVKIS